MIEDDVFFARVFRLGGSSRPHTRFRWLRWLLYTSLVLLCLVAILFGVFQLWVRHAMRTALPQIDGAISIAGLSAPVSVIRDQHGVPHIHAQNQDDLFFAQGYVTAQDRLWHMDILRRAAAGDLAAIFGPSALQHDRVQRILQIRHTADVAVAKLTPADTRWLDDYSRGVNAFIDTHTGDKNSGPLPAEFRLLHYTPDHWQPRDTLLLVLLMAQDLSTGYPTKLGRERVMAKLPPDLTADLYPVGSWRDHPPAQPVTDLTQPQPDIPDVPLDETQSRNNSDEKEYLAALHALRSPGDESCDGCRSGSNDWVVSGAHTVSKLPLLANDMHLGFSIPNIWYIADLEAPGYHAAGVTLPGAPFVVVGHNNSIAWGFTNTGADVQDLYVEQVNASDQASYTDPTGVTTWRPIEHRSEVIHVRGRKDVTLDVRVTTHGPILTPLLPHETRQISLRWIVYEPGAVTVPFYEVNIAQNWQQFCTAFAKYGVPSQNAVYADTAGHIGYHAVGWVPNRPNGLNAVPVTGAVGEWQGIIPFDQMPNVYDPTDGVLATANSRVSPDGDPHPLTLDWLPPYRNERIWKQLLGRDNLKSEDMLALQVDIYSALDHELAQRFAYAIDHTAKTTAHLRQAADILRNWNGEVTTDSPAPAILDAARSALWPLLLTPKLGNDAGAYMWGEKSYVQEELIVHQPARWLPQSYPTWDALLTDAVVRGLDASHAPSDLNKWHWSTVHSVNIKHPLYGLVPMLGALTSSGNRALGGNAATVNAISRINGPSERFTADMSNLDASTMNIVVGESGNPYSPYYRDQWPIWSDGKTFPMPFSDPAAAAAAAHSLTLNPSMPLH